MEGPPAIAEARLHDAHRQTRSHGLDAAIHFVGGVAAGFANVYVGQPLDTVKVKMQTFPAQYKNGLYCFRQTLSTEGIWNGLYRGTVPNLVANVAENSVLFLFYGVCQKFIMSAVGKQKVENLNALENATSGFIAAFFSSLALCPTELVKCRLQTSHEMMKSLSSTGMPIKKMGAFSLTKQIIREDGFRGMFRGLTATFAREMPGYFFFFGGYEVTRNMLTTDGQSKDDIGALKTIVAGGAGGLALWLAIFPADVVKSRVQVMKGDGRFVPVLLKIFREEGITALYKGLGPTLLRTFPSSGAVFFMYENTRKVLSNLAYGQSKD